MKPQGQGQDLSKTSLKPNMEMRKKLQNRNMGICKARTTNIKQRKHTKANWQTLNSISRKGYTKIGINS